MGFHQPQILQERIDTGHSFLQVPQRIPSRASVDNSNPLARFYNDEAPWSTERMRNSNLGISNSFSQPNADFTTYRDAPGSEADQLAPRSDSGYRTLPTHSIISQEVECMDQELPTDVTYQVGNMHVGSVAIEPAYGFDNNNIAPSVTDQTSQYSGRSAARSTGHRKGAIKCTECGEVSKCRSNYK